MVCMNHMHCTLVLGVEEHTLIEYIHVGMYTAFVEYALHLCYRQLCVWGVGGDL